MPAPGAWSFVLPANGATGVSPTPLLTWTAASGAVTYNITCRMEDPPGSGDATGATLAWGGVTGTSLQLPGVPTTDTGGLNGRLTVGRKWFFYGSAVNGDGTTDDTPRELVLLYDSFTVAPQGSRTRDRGRSR